MNNFNENDVKRSPVGRFDHKHHAEPGVSVGADYSATSDVNVPGRRVAWTHPVNGELTYGVSGGLNDDGVLTAVRFDSGKDVEVFADDLQTEHDLIAAHAPVAPALPIKPVETQRRIRGHNFYAPKADRKNIPALYATDGVPAEDKTVHLHYFTGGADWYVTELDPETNEGYGYCDPTGRGGEWGYIDLEEMESLNLGGYRVVERDCHFTPDTFGNISAERH